jgi:hypothetical protein
MMARDTAEPGIAGPIRVRSKVSDVSKDDHDGTRFELRPFYRRGPDRFKAGVPAHRDVI